MGEFGCVVIVAVRCITTATDADSDEDPFTMESECACNGTIDVLPQHVNESSACATFNCLQNCERAHICV